MLGFACVFLAAAERIDGTVPLSVVLSRLGASAELDAKFQAQDISTIADLQLFSQEDIQAFGLSVAGWERIMRCSVDAKDCDADATPIYAELPGRRLSSSSKGRPCRDWRRPGKCTAKKEEGECDGALWGCDRTCGKCRVKKKNRKKRMRERTNATVAASSGSGSASNYSEPLSSMMAHEDDEGDDKAGGSTQLLAATSATAKSYCVDQRRGNKCKVKKQDGLCNTWGCDKTCGRCGALHKALAEQEKKIVSTASRTSLWWIKHVVNEGGYASVIVPTLCKRLDRLVLLVAKLSAMRCLGEVMVVSRSPCIESVQLMLEKNAAAISSQARPGVKLTVVNMGGWDQIYGPVSRFFAASRARQSVLVHLDDDEIPCERQVCRLAIHALQEPIGLYGHHKRICTSRGYSPPGNPKRSNHWHVAPFNVLLTMFASTSRVFNDAFVRYFSPYAEPLASTRGNGEDIAYNHFLLRHFNRTPTYVRKADCGDWVVNGSNVYEGGFSKLNDEVGISAGMNHYRLRRRMCRHMWALPHWGSRSRFGPAKYERLTPGDRMGGQKSAV